LPSFPRFFFFFFLFFLSVILARDTEDEDGDAAAEAAVNQRDIGRGFPPSYKRWYSMKLFVVTLSLSSTSSFFYFRSKENRSLGERREKRDGATRSFFEHRMRSR